MAGESTGGACAGAASKRCNMNVFTGLKCVKCENLYHVSCSKLVNNVKYVSRCSGSQNEHVVDQNDEAAFFDTIDEAADDEKRMDTKEIYP